MDKIIYVSGPFRAETPWLIEQNVRHAEEATLRLLKQGYIPICPHTMTRFFQYECPDDVYLKWGLELLTFCDIIYMLKGYEKSEGSNKELEVANELGLEIIYE